MPDRYTLCETITDGRKEMETGFHKLLITAKKMQRFLNLFIFTGALQVSGGFSAHHQEHITVHTASGTVNQYCC
jgi:hypothetical protein